MIPANLGKSIAGKKKLKWLAVGPTLIIFLWEELMDDGARRWLLKTARKHYWRISSWYDLDDLIQEGYFAYYYVVRRYPKAISPPHRMALFKLVFNSVICNLANQRTRRVEEICMSQLFSDDSMMSADQHVTAFIESVAADPDISEAVGALAAAPEYVKKSLELFASEDGLRRLRAEYRKVPTGKHLRRETLNERLCRLTGYDALKTDIVGGIRACLAGE